MIEDEPWKETIRLRQRWWNSEHFSLNLFFFAIEQILLLTSDGGTELSPGLTLITVHPTGWILVSRFLMICQIWIRWIMHQTHCQLLSWGPCIHQPQRSIYILMTSVARRKSGAEHGLQTLYGKIKRSEEWNTGSWTSVTPKWKWTSPHRVESTSEFIFYSISERDSWLHLTATIEIATYTFLPQSVSNLWHLVAFLTAASKCLS